MDILVRLITYTYIQNLCISSEFVHMCNCNHMYAYMNMYIYNVYKYIYIYNIYIEVPSGHR